MPDKFAYLFIDLGAFLVPFLFSFHRKINFYKHWRSFWLANAIVSILFVIWDSIYTQIGVWGFNERYLVGLYFFGLPIEEIIFFICIPYSSVFTYHCFKVFFPKDFNLSSKWISVALVFFTALLGVTFSEKLYTGVTFNALALVIFVLTVIRKEKWLSNFYRMYLVILLPFFIVNGLLTGTGLDEPVVWYDDTENLGLRMLTIPVEDVFYGMLLLLLNTFLFETFLKIHAKKETAHISI